MCAKRQRRTFRQRFGLTADSAANRPLQPGCKTVSISRFSSIVVFTQHLAVCRRGLPALVPGLNVVAFHLIQLKLLLALHADSLLLLICFPLHVIGERADVQVSFILIEHIRVDS